MLYCILDKARGVQRERHTEVWIQREGGNKRFDIDIDVETWKPRDIDIRDIDIETQGHRKILIQTKNIDIER